MNETALEIIKVLGWFLGGGFTGLGGAWAVLAKAKVDAKKAERDAKKETLEQSTAFNDRLLQYQDNMRAEMLTVYQHLYECHENESRLEGHLGYLEEKFAVPAAERFKRSERPRPSPSEFLKTPLTGGSVDFVRRTNEQDSKALHQAAELRKDPDTLPPVGGAP